MAKTTSFLKYRAAGGKIFRLLVVPLLFMLRVVYLWPLFSKLNSITWDVIVLANTLHALDPVLSDRCYGSLDGPYLPLR